MSCKSLLSLGHQTHFYFFICIYCLLSQGLIPRHHSSRQALYPEDRLSIGCSGRVWTCNPPTLALGSWDYRPVPQACFLSSLLFLGAIWYVSLVLSRCVLCGKGTTVYTFCVLFALLNTVNSVLWVVLVQILSTAECQLLIHMVMTDIKAISKLWQRWPTMQWIFILTQVSQHTGHKLLQGT